jgi:hypothetical protein
MAYHDGKPIGFLEPVAVLERHREQAKSYEHPQSHIGSLLAWIITLSPELRHELFLELGKQYRKDGRLKIRFSK